MSASCDPGNFPYSVAWYASLLFLGFPLMGTDPSNFVFPSLADMSLDAFRSLDGALKPTFDCCRHCVPGTSLRPRKGGKAGPRGDLLASVFQTDARVSAVAVKVTFYYCLLHLFASEERLRNPEVVCRSGRVWGRVGAPLGRPIPRGPG